jgi:isoleucyl-tRNA synthetase
MALIRQLAALGITARAQAGIDRDLLLDRALVATRPAQDNLAGELALFEGLLADALRVSRVEFTPAAEHQVQWQLAPIADRLVSRTTPAAEIAASLAGLDSVAAAELAAQLRDGYSASMEVSGQTITLLPDEVEIGTQVRPGWAAAVEGTCLVVLIPA